MKEKVIQIMPAPQGMVSVYYCESADELFTLPIVALALSELGEDAERSVLPLEFCMEQGVDFGPLHAPPNILGYWMPGGGRGLDKNSWSEEIKHCKKRSDLS